MFSAFSTIDLFHCQSQKVPRAAMSNAVRRAYRGRKVGGSGTYMPTGLDGPHLTLQPCVALTQLGVAIRTEQCLVLLRRSGEAVGGRRGNVELNGRRRPAWPSQVESDGGEVDVWLTEVVRRSVVEVESGGDEKGDPLQHVK